MRDLEAVHNCFVADLRYYLRDLSHIAYDRCKGKASQTRAREGSGCKRGFGQI